MPVSSTIGPSGSGGDGQLIPGGAVGARPGPRPAAAGAGCCASTAIPISTSVKANTFIRIANLSLNVGTHYTPESLYARRRTVVLRFADRMQPERRHQPRARRDVAHGSLYRSPSSGRAGGIGESPAC